jgi:hypothetical protein
LAEIVVRIGDLRWPVMLARRRQNFDSAPGVGIWEDYVLVQRLRAAVEPIKESTFYQVSGITEAIDIGVSHRITFRFIDYIDNTFVVIRDSLRPNSTTRRELFRVRRVKELNGRKRFTSLDVELEQVPY